MDIVHDDLFAAAANPGTFICGSFLISNVFRTIVVPRLEKAGKKDKAVISYTNNRNVLNANSAVAIVHAMIFPNSQEGYTKTPYSEALEKFVYNKFATPIYIGLPIDKGSPPIIFCNTDICPSAAIALTFPLIFDELFAEYPLTENEANIFSDLAEGNTNILAEYLESIMEAICEENEESDFISLASKSTTGQLAELKNSVSRLQDSYKAYSQELFKISKQINEKDVLIRVLENAPDRTDEYKKIFATIKRMGIKIRPTDSSSHMIICQTYLTNYDMDIAETYILGSKSSYFINEPDMKMLFKEIFLNPKRTYKVRIYQSYMWYNDTSLTGIKDKIYDPKKKAVSNPHIHYYNCMGSGRPTALQDARRKGDWEGFFGEISAISSGISWGDLSASKFITAFKQTLFDRSFIEDKEGKIWSPKELLAVLKNKTE